MGRVWIKGVMRPALMGDCFGPLAIKTTYHLEPDCKDCKHRAGFFQTWDVIHRETGFALITNLYRAKDAKHFAEKAVNNAGADLGKLKSQHDGELLAVIGKKIASLRAIYSGPDMRFDSHNTFILEK